MPAGPRTVLHIPHSSVVIPPEIRETFVVSDDELAQELLVSTDWYTDELFALPAPEAVAVRFPVSRLVIDPERFVDDADELLARVGRGVVYTHMADGRPLRRPLAQAECDGLIARYYHPHHAPLANAVGEAVREYGGCLLIDCHSFPSTPLPCDLDRAPDRPDICLGTDPVHTPVWLLDAARGAFEAAGFTVAIDRPYAGVLIPFEHTGAGKGVHALMIEINRRLYIDELTGAKQHRFGAVGETVRAVLRGLIAVSL